MRVSFHYFVIIFACARGTFILETNCMTKMAIKLLDDAGFLVSSSTVTL